MTTSRITWDTEDDGSIEHFLASARGPRPYEYYFILDAITMTWGDAAEVMRRSLKPGAKTVEVEFPNGTRRRYVDMAAARKAVARASASGSHQ